LKDLNSDEFLKRKVATRELIDAGLAAIDPLAAAMQTAQPELIMRGLYILRELAESRHEPTATRAYDAINELAKHPSPAIQRRATTSLERLKELRQHRAAAALQGLGAEIHMQPMLIDSRYVNRPIMLYINEAWEGIDEDLDQLDALQGIKTVALQGVHVTDDWLRRLESLPSIEAIGLKDVTITQAGIHTLKSLPMLQRLALAYTRVDDASVNHILQMNQLRRLRLYDTGVSEEGREKLDRLAIDLEIRNGGFLGISPTSNNLGDPVTVGTVKHGSAAQRAGMVVNDRITHFGGEEVTSFDQLKALIGSSRPGSQIEVRVVRDGKPKMLNVKLGQWDVRHLLVY
jgi:hypothetical protein